MVFLIFGFAVFAVLSLLKFCSFTQSDLCFMIEIFGALIILIFLTGWLNSWLTRKLNKKV